MAHRAVPKQLARELSTNAIWSHKSTTGPRMPEKDVRAAMLLRANSLMKGVSGIRLDIIERYAGFLNAWAPVRTFISGAPLARTAAIWCRCPTLKVRRGRDRSCLQG